MISVIIPIYRVERYLSKCLDTVCNQTFRDLDIILIDDGSPDRSGEICDAYAVKDQRIRVFHTENRSLSCARNHGIEQALSIGSEYLAFVDSDDWLELDMFERLYDLAIKTGAEVTACGAVLEYANQSVPVPIKSCEYRAEGDHYNAEALIALMNGGIREEVWNKLWKTDCFKTIRFPAKWKYQDVGTIFLVIEQTKLVACTEWIGYHYNIYKGSSCRSYVPKDLTYEWFAHHRRYTHFRDVTSKLVGEEKERIVDMELEKTASAISRYWAWVITFSKDEKREYAGYIEEMCSFSKKYFPLFGERSWPMKLRLMVFLTHFNATPAFATAYILNSIRRKLLVRKPG